LLYLALHTQNQRRLQAELTSGGFVDKPVEEWDYEHDLPKLFGGMPVSAFEPFAVYYRPPHTCYLISSLHCENANPKTRQP